VKKLLKILRSVIIAPFVLYGYNLIAAPLNMIIPINIYSILVVGVIGIPGLLMLFIMMLFMN